MEGKLLEKEDIVLKEDRVLKEEKCLRVVRRIE